VCPRLLGVSVAKCRQQASPRAKVEVSKVSTLEQAGSMHSQRLMKAPKWLPRRGRRSWRLAERLGLPRVRLT